MNAALLSVVLPVYNVAPYLAACLDSLAASSLMPDEIIAVDDGSTDACPAILAEYQSRLPNMKIIRQPNAGLSAARNTGLAHARGRYIAFLDSDDMVEPDAYERAVQALEAGRLDLVILNATYHFEGREPDRPVYGPGYASPVVDGPTWLRLRLRAGRLLHMVWMHVYSREFLEQHRLRFIPGLIHEDVIWTTQALLLASRVQSLDLSAVRYRIPVRYFSREVLQNRLDGIVRSSVVNAHELAALAAGVEDQDLRRLLEHNLVDGAFAIFHKLERMPDRAAAQRWWGSLRKAGFFGFLWRHARGVTQRRRIARLWATSLIRGFGWK